MKLTALTTYGEGYGSQLAYSPDGKQWASVGGGQIHLWESDKLSYSADIDDYTSGQLAFAADGQLLQVGPFLFDVAKRKLVPLPPLPNALIAGLDSQHKPQADLFVLNGAAWSPAGDQLVVYCQYQPPRGIGRNASYTGPEKRLLLLDGRKRQLIRVLWEATTFQEYSELALSVAHIAAGGMPTLVWDRQGQSAATELGGHSTTVRHVSFSADGRWLASAGWDGLVVVWDSHTWQQSASWPAHDEYARVAVFHPKRPLVATGGGDDQIKIWDLSATSQRVAHLKVGGHVEALAFAPSGERLIAAVDSGQLLLSQLTA